MENWKKYLFGSATLMLLIFAGAAAYSYFNQTPVPVAVTADPVERKRIEERSDELKEFERANTLSELLKDNTDVTYQYISYDDNGEAVTDFLVVASTDSVFYIDSQGRTEYLNSGRWVGFDPEENNIYTMVCADKDSYDAEYEYLRDSVTLYFDELTVTDSIDKNGGEVIITRSCLINDETLPLLSNRWEGIESGDKYVDTYTFSDGLFREERYGVIRQDGSTKDLGRVVMTLSSGLEPDPGILDVVNSEDQRTVTLHADMDTDEERVITAATGVGTDFLFALPTGYENVYEDKECKIKLEHQDVYEDLEAYIYQTK